MASENNFKNLKKETLKKLVWWVVAVVAACVLANVLIMLVKDPVGRMRFRAINTHFQSTYVLTLEKPEFKRLRLVDLDDPVSLKEIVSKFFVNTPIDLDRL